MYVVFCKMSYFSLSMCTMCVIFWIIPKFWFANKKGNVKSDAGPPNGCSPLMFVLIDCKDSLHPALKVSNRIILVHQITPITPEKKASIICIYKYKMYKTLCSVHIYQK